MAPLLEIRDVDRRFYHDKLEDFLPDQIIDVHTHVWLKDFRRESLVQGGVQVR